MTWNSRWRRPRRVCEKEISVTKADACDICGGSGMGTRLADANVLHLRLRLLAGTVLHGLSTIFHRRLCMRTGCAMQNSPGHQHWPAPPQVEHVCIREPGSMPLPPQMSQASALVTDISFHNPARLLQREFHVIAPNPLRAAARTGSPPPPKRLFKNAAVAPATAKIPREKYRRDHEIPGRPPRAARWRDQRPRAQIDRRRPFLGITQRLISLPQFL